MPSIHQPSESLLDLHEPRRGTYTDVLATPYNLADGVKFSGALYDASGYLIKDSQRAHDNGEPVYPVDPETIEIDRAAIPRVSGRGCYIGHFIARTYGHFITEGLSPYWVQGEIECDYLVGHPFLWGDRIFPFAQEAFDMIGVDGSKVHLIKEPTIFDELVIPERIWKMNQSVNAKYNSLLDRIRVPKPNGTGLKIYLSRREIGRRAVPNEAEMEDVFTGLGFTVIHPQNLTFRDQVQLFGRADALAGIAGSALHNVIFCAPGTPVISIGDKRTGMTINQPVCGSLIGGATAEIRYEPEGEGFNISFLRAEMEQVMAEI